MIYVVIGSNRSHGTCLDRWPLTYLIMSRIMQISTQIMVWLGKKYHMTAQSKNRQSWPTDLVNEAKKAYLQEYTFQVTKCQFNGFKITKMSKWTYHAQLQYQIYIAYKFWVILYIRDWVLLRTKSIRPSAQPTARSPGRPPARSARPPIRHGHDNTPCSQRLRGKKLWFVSNFHIN